MHNVSRAGPLISTLQNFLIAANGTIKMDGKTVNQPLGLISDKNILFEAKCGLKIQEMKMSELKNFDMTAQCQFLEQSAATVLRA